jgi:hypothetical protein
MPVERELLHNRDYSFRGYRRADGLWDIDGRMTDSKSFAFDNDWRGEIQPGEPLHDMRIRLTLDDDFVVREIEVKTAAAPFRICGDITPSFAAIKGLRVGPGWRAKLRELLGGVKGCTHQVELLAAMATVAFQTIRPRRDDAAVPGPAKRPGHLGTCHALATDGEVVRRFWPDFYTGS